MKKVISYLITIMMVFTMMPYVAFADNMNDQTAEENETIALYVEQENELYTEGDAVPEVEVIDVEPFSDIDEGIAPNGSDETQYAETVEEAAVDLRSAMVERQTNVVVNIKVDELTEEALTTKCAQIFEEALKHTGNPKEGDSLKWVWENWGCSISGTSDGTNCYAEIKYNISYYTTAEQEAALTNAIEFLKTELDLDGKTDYEIIKAIYDYMVANISYDYTNLDDDSHKLKYTAYAALVDKTSVCQGYATLFYRLALEYGIDTRVIAGESLNNNGESERHAWNIVKLGDKYYNLDSTWDSTWDSDKTKHTYFLKGSDEFINHTSDSDYTTVEFNTLYSIDSNNYIIESDSEIEEDPIEPDVPENPDGNDVIHSGVSGDLAWSIKENGEFVLEGDGSLATNYSGSFCTDKDGNELFIRSNYIPWKEYSDEIITAKIKVKNAYSLASILSECYNLESVDFTGSDTSKTVDFACMISTNYAWIGKTNKLKHVDLSMLDTSSAIRMTQLLWGCANLETVDVSGWNTSNVTDLGSAFDSCESLTTIKGVENWDTSNVTKMYSIFQCCKSLKSLDLSKWNTSSLIDVDAAFNNCSNLENLNISTWDVSKVKSFYRMFDSDCKLKELDLTSWNMKNATCIDYMFSWCYELSGGITFSSNISDYNMAFYAASINSKEPFVIEYKDDCSAELVLKIYETNDGYNGNLLLKGPECMHEYKLLITEPTCTESGYTTYKCTKCIDRYVSDETDPLGHDYEAVEIKPTCTEGGFITYTCRRDATHTYRTDFGPEGHDMQEHDVVAATCEEAGNIVYYTCDACDKYFLDEYGVIETTAEDVVVAATGHYPENDALIRAEVGKPGKTAGQHCRVCQDVLVKQADIPAIVKPTAVSKTYTGKYMTPKVYIKDTKGKTIKTVTMSKGKNVGTYSKTVALSGNYFGKVKVSYKINPKGTSISSLAKVKKGFTVKWKKQTGKMAKTRITGYQYRYSTSSKMTNATIKTVKGYGKTSAKKTGLKAKKTYYVQVRTYKTVSGVKYYSPWSKYKKVKTK